MTFSEMIRALRLGMIKIVSVGPRFLPDGDAGFAGPYACWTVEELATKYRFHVPLPEGWVLPPSWTVN